jgi:hypothetical protein
LEFICVLEWIYNVFGVKNMRASDLVYDIICLDPVTTCHFSQLQVIWPHRRSSSLHFLEWWAAFSSNMGLMFDTTCDQMKNWRWDNPSADEDQVDNSNLQSSSLGTVQYTGECFSWYCGDDLLVHIEPPSCWQYKPGDFLGNEH